MKPQISRELDRLELLLQQIKAVEAERNTMLAASEGENIPTPAKMLMQLRGIGSESAMVLWAEGLFRHFDNRRQVAAYAGLAPTPWQAGRLTANRGSPNPETTGCGQLAAPSARFRPQSLVPGAR